MIDCKNCKYTDEYCASGDCTVQNELTEQWKKGELPEGWYWVRIKTWCEYITMLYYTSDIFLDGDVPVDNDKIIEVLAPVPSYDEWQAKLEENTQLKELLKEWVQFEIEENPNDFTVMSERMSELANKTKEDLK